MKRLILVAVLVTVLLVAFAGSALADGPYYGYGQGAYNMGYGQGYGGAGYGASGYGGHNMGYYGGYQKPQHYPKYNYCCYVYNPCPYNNPVHKPYYGGYVMQGGYGMPSGYMSYGGYGY